ncbi:MAG: glycoside hydrolase family 88 protein [Bacteroidota bacterium]
MNQKLFLLLITLLFQACSFTSSTDKERHLKDFEKILDDVTQRSIDYLEQVEIDSTQIPRSIKKNGLPLGTTSKSWTSGFYPGLLWQLYAVSKEEELQEAASNWMQFVKKEKDDRTTHDLGFKVYCSFGNAYKIMPNEQYKQVIVEAAETLSQRYNPVVGSIRSWDFNKETWEFPVIIDNMMNLELLFEASKLSGDTSFAHIAYTHAKTTLKNHIREDFSSYHVVDYDTLTGKVNENYTHQGYSRESSWARGQAWNLYGFAMTYRQTRDEAFLQQAKRIATFIFEHPNLPKHGIPFWDFNAPKIPNEPLDASAAAVIACGLLILCEEDAALKEKYIGQVDKILQTLSSDNFKTNVPPFLLNHSVGSVPGDFEIDVPLIYADYYYVEALVKRVQI